VLHIYIYDISRLRVNTRLVAYEQFWNFTDAMCLRLNTTRAIHAHYEFSSIFPSFLYRPIPLSTVYHSHMDTLLLRCMNNGQSILTELLELVSFLCQITTKAQVTSVQISKFFHFTFSLPSLSYLYLTRVFGRTFCNTFFVLRDFLVTLLNS